MSTVCTECGNNHFGPCATEYTCFLWTPPPDALPNEVLIAGSWHKWQSHQKLSRYVKETGEVYFKLFLTLLAGQYYYKYIVDGVWKHDPNCPTVKDPYGTENNIIKVYPKKMYIPINNKGQIKIISGIIVYGLHIVGSWDNWTNETRMVKTFNQLKACDENVAYINVYPDRFYEFKFKFNKQFLIDYRYPTLTNSFNTLNNVVITYCELERSSTKSIYKTDTPSKWRSSKYFHAKELDCKAFEWKKVGKEFYSPYVRVEGHSMCNVGDFLYIFGGKCRSEFYNSMTKVNIHELKTACYEEALPNGRAFHAMVVYGNKIIIYGGCNKAVLEDYYSFNVSYEKWIGNPVISGKYPYKKYKQSCVIYYDMLVFFGGYYCSPDFYYEYYYQKLSVLDLEYMKWIDPIKIIGTQPAGRFAHTASLIGSDMYIFGGTCSTADNANLNDIWKINLSKENELSWVELHPTSKLPKARHGHTMNSMQKFLIIFGGQDNKGIYLNDVVVFDSVFVEWIYPIVTGDAPTPRSYHSTATFNDYIIVFGGKTKNLQKNENFYLLRVSDLKDALNVEEDNDY